MRTPRLAACTKTITQKNAKDTHAPLSKRCGLERRELGGAAVERRELGAAAVERRELGAAVERHGLRVRGRRRRRWFGVGGRLCRCRGWPRRPSVCRAQY